MNTDKTIIGMTEKLQRILILRGIPLGQPASLRATIYIDKETVATMSVHTKDGQLRRASLEPWHPPIYTIKRHD
jgi:hypothetical protein